MKHLFYIVSLLMMLFSSFVTFAQTPFDAFSPETSRPILDGDSIAAWRTEHRPDTVFCAIVADLRNEQLLLVDIKNSSVLAYAPFTDEMKNWISVDPLADKNIQSSPYMYCSGNPIMFFDPNGKDDEWVWDGETATRTHIDNGTDFVRVNGVIITDYDYSPTNIGNIDMLESILPFYYNQAGVVQSVGCVYYGRPATALTDFADGRLIGLIIDEDGRLEATLYTACNLINIFSHEGFHKNDSYKNASSWIGELQAVETQMNHSSWEGTTKEFKEETIGRAIRTIMREINEKIKTNPEISLSMFQLYIPSINLNEYLSW